MHGKKLNLSLEQVKEAVQNTDSMNHAADFLGVTLSSFARYAKRFGLYQPNQGGKGRRKPKVDGKGKIALEDVLKKCTRYKSATLKQRLYDASIKKPVCEICNITTWCGKPIAMHLDHRDGDHTNNELQNLRILCPNCHAQTPTYCRGKYRNGKRTLV